MFNLQNRSGCKRLSKNKVLLVWNDSWAILFYPLFSSKIYSYTPFHPLLPHSPQLMKQVPFKNQNAQRVQCGWVEEEAGKVERWLEHRLAFLGCFNCDLLTREGVGGGKAPFLLPIVCLMSRLQTHPPQLWPCQQHLGNGSHTQSDLLHTSLLIPVQINCQLLRLSHTKQLFCIGSMFVFP